MAFPERPDDLPIDDEPDRQGLPPELGGSRRVRRMAVGTAILVVLGLLLYYPLGMLGLHKIDDNPDFAPDEVAPGASRAVAVAAALIDREVNLHGWTANDPFFMPGAALDNMPNFQQGIVAGLSRFAIEMTDQIGRTRGTSQADADLDKAAGLLKYPGNVWVWDPSTSLAITASSETQYLAARRALLSYNTRLAAGQAVFDRRADNLLSTIERMVADLGSASATLDLHLAGHAGSLIDLQADDIFYVVKGRTYAYALLLRELGHDYETVIAERDAEAVWAQMMDSAFHASTLQPWVILNGSPDSQFVPSHLAAQGFYLLRFRAQLRELANVLLK